MPRMAQMPQKLDRDAIAARIPHAGAMCLLDRIDHWDDAGIEGRTRSHRLVDNPLRFRARLPAEAGIEYAAQAMAVHGGLRAAPGSSPQRGFVAVVQRVTWTVERLDTQPGELAVTAEIRQAGNDASEYAFRLIAGEQALVEGEALVMLEARGS
jgi:predicted hotdog family 3-hydroxylacyl-ACP dehydratase